MHGDTFSWNVVKFEQTILECIYNTQTKCQFICTGFKETMFKVTFVSTRKSVSSIMEVHDRSLYRLDWKFSQSINNDKELLCFL